MNERSALLNTYENNDNDHDDNTSSHSQNYPIIIEDKFMSTCRGSVSIQTVQGKRRPRAVVVLLGWLGARERYLDKYAKVWQERDCTTISVITSMWVTMTGIGRYSVAEDVIREVDKIGRAAEMSEAGWGNLPVILHVFSNGGAFVLQSIEELLTRRRTVCPSSNITESVKERKLRHICESFSNRVLSGCTIYDSAPCYPSYVSGIRAIGRAVPVPIVNVLCQALFLLYVLCVDYIPSSIKRLILGEKYRFYSMAENFWNSMETCRLTSKEAYVYSTNDDLASYHHLDKLVEIKTAVVQVLKVLRYKDSQHVGHMRTHPHDYHEMIDTILSSVADTSSHLDLSLDDDAW